MTVAKLNEADLNTMTLRNARLIKQLGRDSRNIPYRLILESPSRCDPLLPKVNTSGGGGVNSGEMMVVVGESPSNLRFRQLGILEALYSAGDRWADTGSIVVVLSADEGVVSDDWIIYDLYPGHSLRR
ncbi:hypothetical protein SLS58_005977 [Diplodia intermedia]|uniref:Uncharacterized protein n=1 Tax=Diplodia intermedia TaxID=856260 RepID=A0ABR3TP32_9PEZI